MATKKKTKAATQKSTLEAFVDGLHKRREYIDHQTLTCDLTDVEVLAASRVSSDLKKEIDETETDMKEDAKGRKDHIKILRGRFDDVMEKIGTGEELRDVEVLITYDYEDGIYIAVRQDTREEIARRPLRENERQQELPGTSSDDDSDNQQDDSADGAGNDDGEGSED